MRPDREAPPSAAYSSYASDEQRSTPGCIAVRQVVPEVGLEPTLAEANTALNRARLPIPPLRQRDKSGVYQGARVPANLPY